MAPEIVTKKEFSGLPADIWALGVVLWVLLVGTYPFRGNDDRDLYRKISIGVLRVPDSVPEMVRGLLKSMLSSNPDHRPSAEEILNHRWLLFINK